ncbi:MAG: pyrroline-5-carboxylate reductase [Muribaculaceae bacterium]|nr:pyrroline-5-carboxylate reductase [Muribaculaceae bacterium]
MKKKIAIIGTGNMGSAVAASLPAEDYEVVCTAASRSTLERIKKELPGVEVTTDNSQAVKDADLVVLAVKPYIAPEIMPEIIPGIKDGATIISVIAGLPLENLEQTFSAESRKLNVFRVIPNTAIRNGKSATFVASSKLASSEAVDEVMGIFNRSGKAFLIPEKNMAACTALASCGIAFFLRFIRAAAEGAVELGLKADFATEVAALTAAGAASLLSDGSHPEAEIDKVTTPGGLTIKGLNAMEDKGFTSAVIAGLRASVVK